MKKVRRILIVLISVVLVLGLTGCGKKNDAVFTLNGTTVDKKAVDIFGFIYVAEHSLVDYDQLSDVYEDGETYAEHYKNDLEQDIILSVLLNKEADDNKIVLSAEDMTKAEERADALAAKLGSDRLKDAGIDKNDIKKIYEMRLHGNSYAASIGEYQVDGAGNIENVKDIGGDDKADDSSEGEDTDRYIRVFQITFPTVIYDENGMLQTDNDGQLIRVSSEEMDNMKQSAESFSEKAGEGEDVEKLLKDEPVNVTGVERVLKYNDLSDDYKKAVSGLMPGAVSGVIPGEYGYYIVKMLDPADNEHAETIKNYEVQKESQEARQKLFDRLFDVYVGNDKGYRDDEMWDSISITDYTI